MSDLVGHPEDRFYNVTAHMLLQEFIGKFSHDAAHSQLSNP